MVRTLQDIYDAMAPDEKDFQALIVGAALAEADLSGDRSVLAQFNGLSVEERGLLEFLVGNIVADEIEHSDLSDGEKVLAHHGVKGMRWGVRKDLPAGMTDRISRSTFNTPGGRAGFKELHAATGSPTFKELSSMKSDGHRAINAFTGDKTFWKRMAITAGASAAGVALSFAGPFALPDSALASMGAGFLDNSSYGKGINALGGVPRVGNFSVAAGKIVDLREVGQVALTTAGISATATVAGVVTAANAVANVGRAALSNRITDKRMETAFGKTLYQRQTTGRDRLNDMFNGAKRKSDTKEVQHSMSDSPQYEIFAIENDEQSLKHFGVKGMKWGIRKKDGGGDASHDEVTAHNKLTDQLVKYLKSTSTENQVEDFIDKAYLNGYVESHVKIAGVDVSQDRKKVVYAIKAYRLTPGMANTHSGDGVKVEHITKTVPRSKPASNDKDLADKALEGLDMVNTASILLGHSEESPYEIFAIESDEESLKHFGVKGMKWGVRRVDPSSSAGVRLAAAKSGGLAAAKILATRGLAPALAATGVGLPLAAAAGISVKMLADPDVREAISAAGSWAKSYAGNSFSDISAKASDFSKNFEIGTKSSTKNFGGATSYDTSIYTRNSSGALNIPRVRGS